MVSNETIRRARSDAAKLGRLNAILFAAREAFLDNGFEKVSMDDIAARAGVAKGTLYLYCRTKEEVFLALAGDVMAEWFAAIEQALATPHRGADLAMFARFFANSAADRPDLLRLALLLHVVLERNVSEEVLLPFKAGLRDALLRMGAALEQRVNMPAGTGVRFLVDAYALMIGFANLSHPAPAVAAILERGDMALLRVEFRSGLTDALMSLAAGYQTSSTMETVS